MFIRFIGLEEPDGTAERPNMPGKALLGALYKSETKFSLIAVGPNINSLGRDGLFDN